MTNAGQGTRAMEIAAEALERTPSERTAFLEDTCGIDAALRSEVESLLRFERPAEGFIARSAVEMYPQAVLDSPGVAQASSVGPGRTLGRFQILSLLGEGGMGEVYLADDTELRRQVAIKLVKWGGGTEALLRHFEQEKRILAGLNDPHIARLYGAAITDDGRPYLVMEYVEGEPLDTYCRGRRLSVTDRLVLFRKVCAAVSHAHQHLVVHRDLKPANIRVTPEGEPKLLDFGIAKLLDPAAEGGEGHTVTQLGAMTQSYASPEQLRGESVTTGTDTYSLGVVLFELLSGQRPYRVTSRRPDELARAICEQEPTRLSVAARREITPGEAGSFGGEPAHKLRRRLAGDLETIVATAMRKEPERRYASVAQFSEDIRRHCAGLAVFARKDTVGYRTGKFVRRNKVVVAAVGLVGLSLIGGLAMTIWQTRVARQERDTARVALRQAERLDDFLQNLLRSADPSKMGKDVKVVQVLDAAGENLDRDLADEPDSLARAHESIAFVYGRLGQFLPSERHMRAALEIRRRIHGEDDPATMRAELWMAGAFCNQARYSEAEPLARQALAGRLRQSPPDPYWTARTTDLLSVVLSQTGRPVEAEKMLRQSLAAMRTARGENCVESINILAELGIMKLGAGHLTEAESDLRRAITLYDVLGPHGEYAIPAQRELAVCLLEEQQLPEAEQVVQRLEADTLRLLGGEGLPYAWIRLIKASLDFAKKDYAAVIAEVRQPLELIASTTPAEHQKIVLARGLLGLALTRTGKATDGEPILRLAYTEGKNLKDSTLDLTIGNVSSALGECLLAQGRYDEAEPLLLAGYDQLKSRLGAQHSMTVGASNRLRDFYVLWQKPDRAELRAWTG